MIDVRLDDGLFEGMAIFGIRGVAIANTLHVLSTVSGDSLEEEDPATHLILCE